MKAQTKKENAAAAGANCENVETKTEEVERMCTGNIVSDSVVTANEAGGWHRGRPVLFTASEDEDHIAFNNDHVKHDMNDGPNENEKTDAESKRIESTYSETTPFVAVETAEVTDTIEKHGVKLRITQPVREPDVDYQPRICGVPLAPRFYRQNQSIELVSST